MLCWQFEKNPSRTRTERGGVPRSVQGHPRTLSSILGDGGRLEAAGKPVTPPTFGGFNTQFMTPGPHESPETCSGHLAPPARRSATPHFAEPAEEESSQTPCQNSRSAGPDYKSQVCLAVRPGRGCPW